MYKGHLSNGTTLIAEAYTKEQVMKTEEKDPLAMELYRRVKARTLREVRERNPEDRQGVEFEMNGKTYVAFIRRLTATECSRLQTVPESYDWSGTSETQRLKMLGNGWTVEVYETACADERTE